MKTDLTGCNDDELILQRDNDEYLYSLKSLQAILRAFDEQFIYTDEQLIRFKEDWVGDE